MSKEKKIKITYEFFEFVQIRNIIHEFIRENNEFLYTIDDIFKLIVCPYNQTTPIENNIDFFPIVKRLCDFLVEIKELYKIEIDEEDYYYFFRIGRKKNKCSSSN